MIIASLEATRLAAFQARMASQVLERARARLVGSGADYAMLTEVSALLREVERGARLAAWYADAGLDALVREGRGPRLVKKGTPQ